MQAQPLKVKGTPSINNIQTIVMGVINNSEERIYGKVLVNELRMTGVIGWQEMKLREAWIKIGDEDEDKCTC